MLRDPSFCCCSFATVVSFLLIESTIKKTPKTYLLSDDLDVIMERGILIILDVCDLVNTFVSIEIKCVSTKSNGLVHPLPKMVTIIIWTLFGLIIFQVVVGAGSVFISVVFVSCSFSMRRLIYVQ